MKIPAPWTIVTGTLLSVGALAYYHRYSPSPAMDDLRDAPLNEIVAGPVDEPSDGVSMTPTQAEARPLARATPEEIAAQFEKTLSARLDKALARHPDIKMVTKDNAYELTKSDGGNSIDSTLEYALIETLEYMKRRRAMPETLKRRAKILAMERLTAAAENGYVTTIPYLGMELLGDARHEVALRNALRDFKAPQGVELAKLLEQWATVREDSNLDSDVLYPVVFSQSPSLGDLRKVFPQLRPVSLASTKWKAVDDFAQSPEGPEGDANFKPIADVLKGPGIKQRFYFAGGGNGWSSNVLVVVDEHDQAWGFQMGYSE